MTKNLPIEGGNSLGGEGVREKLKLSNVEFLAKVSAKISGLELEEMIMVLIWTEQRKEG